MTRGRALRLVLRLALASLVTVLGAEVALRVFGLAKPADLGYPRGMYAPDDTLSFKLAADFEGMMSVGEHDIPLSTNGRGFRDDPIGPKDADTLRILALGDSFGFGHNVAAADSYPEQMERLLGEQGRRLEVLNLGVPGYNTRQELEQLRLHADLTPDLVILGCYLGNDPSGNLESRTPRARSRHGVLVGRSPGEAEWRVRLRADLGRYSRLWNAWRQWTRRRQLRSLEAEEGALQGVFCESMDWGAAMALDLHRVPPTPDAEAAMAITRETLAELHAFARDELGVAFVLVLLPSPFQYWPPALEQLRVTCGRDPAAYDMDRPNAELLAVGSDQGFPVLDLTPAFRARMLAAPAEPLCFDVHFNEAGHRLAAEEIARFLTQGGWLD